MDNPGSPAKPPFPIVGVGASAGGLAAFEAFFSGVTRGKKPGMAFVLVQHLDPQHKSLLPDLIRNFCDLPVREVAHGMRVQNNEIHVIPSGKEMTIRDGILCLAAQGPHRGTRLPIDVFFQSLAEDRGHQAVAVVLSGTGGDGSLGIREIHNAGGLVLAQDQGSAEYYGMPGSADKSGFVNFSVPPAQMVAQIQAHFQHRKPSVSSKRRSPKTWDDGSLPAVFSLLQARTSHDFTKYKPSTIRRRIERRMAVNRVETLADYLALMTHRPEEVLSLFSDLLIGVTSFFRDPKVFQFLADVAIPRIIDGATPQTPIRVWSAGCSTGEEPYSLAILLQERLESLGVEGTMNVFATDIDARAIESARTGRFPSSIAADLTGERVSRFFSPDQDGAVFKVKKTIRDSIVFSEHDLIKDPPFFRLDLLVCRNLLIYLSLELQRKIIPMFHYALKPGGILVLGTSETIGEFGHLFQALDQTCKVFVRRETLSTYPRTDRQILPFSRLPAPAPEDRIEPAQVSLRTLTEQTLLRVQDMAAALVNAQGDALYLHGRTGYFLEPPPGITGTLSILKLAKEGLRYPLVNALHRAVTTNQVVRVRDLQIPGGRNPSKVHIGIYPLEPGRSGPSVQPLFLIVFEEGLPNEGASMSEFLDPEVNARIEHIMRELATKEEYLRSTTEEMETSNEELRSSNEELQSVNEELQSTNEELETSKEELQSVNEELSTVNAELNSKVSELTTANNDMNNLLAATGIATVFVDHGLNILRFTPEATRVINLIPGDLGRPVGHLASNLVDYRTLERDTQAVLDTLVPKEVEVLSQNDSWYRLRIQPYRTLDNVIEGAVISFIDITEIVRQRESLRKNNDLLRLVSVVHDAREAIIVRDLEGRILAWNPAAVSLYGWTENEAVGALFQSVLPPDLRGEPMETLNQKLLTGVVEPYHSRRVTKEGQTLTVSVTPATLVNAAGKIYALKTIEFPIAITLEP